jgi:hypothetical protein
MQAMCVQIGIDVRVVEQRQVIKAVHGVEIPNRETRVSEVKREVK